MAETTRLDPPAELNGNGLARDRGMHAAASRDLSERDMHAAAAAAGVERLIDETVTLVNANGDSVVLPAQVVFEKAIGPLEASAGKRLNGPGLQLCRAAFRENPDGFRLIAADALARALVNPLGLLVRMVRDGDHRQEAPPPPETDDERRVRWLEEEMAARENGRGKAPVVCPSCGTGAGLHAHDCELA
jgi:hypothetical protein